MCDMDIASDAITSYGYLLYTGFTVINDMQ